MSQLKIFDATKIIEKDLSVMIVDIDEMKKLNDTNQSHSAGTAGLVKIVNTIKKYTKNINPILIRPEQAAYIIVLFENSKTSDEEIRKIAQFIQRDIKNEGLSLDNKPKYPLTVSIGISHASKDSYMLEDLLKLIHSANLAISTCKKRTGRNEVFREYTEELVAPDHCSRNKIFHTKLLEKFDILNALNTDLLNIKDKLSPEYLEKLISLKHLMTDIVSKEEVTGLHRRSFVYNFPEKNRILNQILTKTIDRPLSVAIIDVDDLSQKNKEYGPVGDMVMALVSEKVQKNLGLNNIAYSHAGDEIMIICPNTDENSIMKLAEKIRNDVTKIVLPICNTKPITISAGIKTSTCRTSNINELKSMLEKMIDDCDKGLYWAKKNGKNQVKSYESLSKHVDKTILQKYSALNLSI